MSTQHIPYHKIKKSLGFTLIELIVTVVIVGIIFAAGIPGLNALLGNVSINSSADKLVNSLAYARGESVARVDDISVGAIGGGRVGWNVYIDDDADCTLDNGEEILRVVDITADNVSITAGPTCIGFNELGENRANAIVNLTIDSGVPSIPSAVVAVFPGGHARVQ